MLKIERCFHQTFFLFIAQHICLGSLSKNQIHGSQENGFSRAGFSRYDIQLFIKLNIHGFNDGVILYGK